MAVYKYIGPDRYSTARSVEITDETALWLGRMTVGEGGFFCSEDKIAAMIWALLNRWFLHPQRLKWRSFLYLVRRFSQPINPRWARGGDLARKYANTVYTTEEKFKRREYISTLEWAGDGGTIPYHIEQAIIEAQEGSLLPPQSVLDLRRPRISNWASHKNLKQKRPWGIAFEQGQRFDWFFEDMKLIEGHVVVDPWI